MECLIGLSKILLNDGDTYRNHKHYSIQCLSIVVSPIIPTSSVRVSMLNPHHCITGESLLRRKIRSPLPSTSASKLTLTRLHRTASRQSHGHINYLSIQSTLSLRHSHHRHTSQNKSECAGENMQCTSCAPTPISIHGTLSTTQGSLRTCWWRWQYNHPPLGQLPWSHPTNRAIPSDHAATALLLHINMHHG